MALSEYAQCDHGIQQASHACHAHEQMHKGNTAAVKPSADRPVPRWLKVKRR